MPARRFIRGDGISLLGCLRCVVACDGAQVEPEPESILYAGFSNTITLRFLDAGGELLGKVTGTIATPPLLTDPPDITIDAATPAMTPGMNLVSHFGYASECAPQRPFIDADGAIRWYLDLPSHPNLGICSTTTASTPGECGPVRRRPSTGRIVEMDMLGRVVRTWTMPGYSFQARACEAIPAPRRRGRG